MSKKSGQDNDYQIQLECYKTFIPLYLFFNMHNYARHGAYYSKILKNMEELYLENNKIMQSISVQAQERHRIRTATDMRGKEIASKDFAILFQIAP